ncbi:MAG: hypothetical protein H6861_07950 [Rhodospirillales bacterium]|nr:hypothetical protein [Rhodospirillales bacterium]
MKKFVIFFSLILIGGASSPVRAEEKAQEQPSKNAVLEAAAEIMKGLDEPSKRHFSVMYGNYNLIQVVETVRESVELAVEACGEANPDLKEPLETRFDEWKAAVKPVMEEADANVGNMILAQDYAKPKDLKKFFKLVDKTRREKEKEIDKVPVTSQEGCQTLLENMEATQPEMIRLLNTTLVSLPMVMRQQEEAEKAKAEEQAVEKAEQEDEDSSDEE